MPHPDVSVLTIAKGRAAHLANVVRGLAKQTVPPREMVVGVMQDAPYGDLPPAPFPVRQVQVTGAALPLAAARNAAALAAVADMLMFVDVDCIPDPRFVADYTARMAGRRGLFMGEVMYLPGGATDAGLDWDRFAQVAVRHSDRQGPPAEGVARCEDYRCFWSLNFAMSRDDWTAAGGFDERYVGYGGEDTDFGRTLDARGLPIWWVAGARVYHQYHPHAMPPVHHIASVVRNADLFAEKWGHRTMEHWLYAFQLMGLIEKRRGEIVILREPDDRDMDLCRQQAHQPYANTRRVLDMLQGIGAEAAGDAARAAEVKAAQAQFLHAAE
ncbi:glycosyl transferase [Rhodobacteraceae bacterium CCMM004]|nr:glycosyl transferase [Rhodobacteraceae bacterium CCMM004]